MSNLARGTAWTNVRPGFHSGTFATNGVYSVWSWDKGMYDYYQADASNRPGYGSEVKPPITPNALSGMLGEDPDRSGHSMPRSAKYVGSGSVAMGEIVSVAQPAAGLGAWTKVALALAIPTAILWLTTRM